MQALEKALREQIPPGAAFSSPAGTGDAVVLGRWVVSLVGDDSAAVDAFAARLVDLGGVSISA